MKVMMKFYLGTISKNFEIYFVEITWGNSVWSPCCPKQLFISLVFRISSSLRPGSKALTGENNLLVMFLNGIDGSGTRFSTRLRFNVPNILKYNR